jgi:hypothetical protein
MLSYASLALKCDLSKFSRDAVADRPAATGLAS